MLEDSTRSIVNDPVSVEDEAAINDDRIDPSRIDEWFGECCVILDLRRVKQDKVSDHSGRDTPALVKSENVRGQ